MNRRFARRILMCCIGVACGSTFANEPLGRVTVQSGNIVYSDSTGATEVLTETGADDGPVLSPEGTLLAFTRTRVSADPASFEPPVNDLYMIHLQSHKTILLVKGQAKGQEKRAEDCLASIHGPVFSPDSKTVYFMTDAWATSSAILAVPTAGGAPRFLTHGNSLDVVSQGKYKGALLITQHRYMDGAAGAWNPMVLVSTSGKLVKIVGEGPSARRSVETEH